MRKQIFKRRKNTLAILVVFFVIVSMTATVVSAADGMRDHKGDHREFNHGERNFRNWHEHRHHRHHDHYYGGTYYPDYEWVYNPETLVWDWTYLPVAVEQQPVMIEQPIVEQQPVVVEQPVVETQPYVEEQPVVVEQPVVM